ncbi:hypothetical protein L916_14255 [Phytophthora nicotianae]|uniref:Uncharacterized protein n=1 Tax=Phytophthora nicotianae TaxID=4792 RepID=W2IGP8_PHYNI|nr:hypothetical protein L916_14255 [Phytophthora nicotianae]
MARIRASARGKTDAVAAVARDIDFHHLWRQLRGAGWMSKRPRGMQTQWRYVSPGGVHSFVGEDAVVVHAIESGLLDVDDVESEVDAVGEGVEAAKVVATGNEGRAEADADEDIRPSQIDSSAQLLQNTLNELFGAKSDSEVDLSQAAVTRAFDVSPGDLHAADSQRDCDANLQLLSEVSGAESDGAQVNAAAVEPTRALRPRVHVKKDANYVPEDENLSAYESFSSDESESGEIVEGDGNAVPIGSESDEDVTENDAVEMNNAFVQSVQIGNGTLPASATQQLSAALRAMTWSLASGSFEEDVRPYPGLNMKDAEPVVELRSQCYSPLLTLFYFLPKSLWVRITEKTNRYCQQNIERRAPAILAQHGPGQKETLTQVRRRLKAKLAIRHTK